LKQNLLQLFTDPQHSEWFSALSVSIFEVNIVSEHKQAYWWSDLRGKFVCRRYYQTRRQYFTWVLFDIVTKQPLRLLVSWKSVRYLNLVNIRPSYKTH